jgi:hypothetical protein
MHSHDHHTKNGAVHNQQNFLRKLLLRKLLVTFHYIVPYPEGQTMMLRQTLMLGEKMFSILIAQPLLYINISFKAS